MATAESPTRDKHFLDEVFGEADVAEDRSQASHLPPGEHGRSLEWATSCPPPRHNFTSLPRIRSESPAFDLHFPQVAAAETPTRDKHFLDEVFGEADVAEDRSQILHHDEGEHS